MYHLKKAYEVAEHQSVDVGQLVDYGDGCVRIGVVFHTFLIEVGRDERLVQLSIPQFEQ